MWQYQVGDAEAETESRQTLIARIAKDTLLQELLHRRYEKERDRIKRVVRNLRRAEALDKEYVIQHGINIDTTVRTAEHVEEQQLEVEKEAQVIEVRDVVFFFYFFFFSTCVSSHTDDN